jgi:hypothetical protein
MTVSELKSGMDRRFNRVDRRFDRMDRRFDRMDRRFDRMDRRFDRLERTKVDKTEFRRAIDRLRTGLRREIAASAEETRRYVDTIADGLRISLRDEIASFAAENRRHFQVLAEAIRADIRVFADVLADHTDKLALHETRITKLERRGI